MRFLQRILTGATFGVLAAAGQSQSTVPALGQAIGSQTLAVSGAPVSLDLKPVFTLPGVTGPIAQFDTVSGKFNVELRQDAAPRHVANFLAYVDAGAYANSVIHRSATFDGGAMSIIQGGGRKLPITNGNLPEVSKFAPVALEYNLPNARGTLAAARTSDPGSATSEWFFNVRDNSSILGPGNGGGYSVFGRVLGTGMTVVDAIAALPRVNAGGVFSELPVRNFSGETILDANLVAVTSVTRVPVYPETHDAAAVLRFTATSSNAETAAVTLAGSTLAVIPRAAGTANITVRATDTNGGTVEQTFAVTVANGPTFTAQPESQTVAMGASVELRATVTGATNFQWMRNGVNIAGATGATYTIPNARPEHAGIYVVQASNGSVTTQSRAAIVGVTGGAKVEGAAAEVGPNIVHPNGNTYDQVLLQGAAATVRADAGQVLRVSFLDESDDIVQAEFSGAGSLTVTLDNPSAAAPAGKYNQANVSYVKGRATLVLAGADATTNLTVFSVGRGTAVNQALFRTDVTYDGHADVAAIAVTSADAKFAGLRAANVRFGAPRGVTGVYAPGVAFGGPVNLGDIVATGTAAPMISLASVEAAKIAGGDLFQPNAQPVRVDGLQRLEMAPGTDSHDRQLPASEMAGRLERDGADVTSEVVVETN